MRSSCCCSLPTQHANVDRYEVSTSDESRTLQQNSSCQAQLLIVSSLELLCVLTNMHPALGSFLSTYSTSQTIASQWTEETYISQPQVHTLSGFSEARRAAGGPVYKSWFSDEPDVDEDFEQGGGVTFTRVGTDVSDV